MLNVTRILQDVKWQWDWLCNVTRNDISVICVPTLDVQSESKKLNLRSGSQRHRHFVGFLNVPIQAPKRATLCIRLFRETNPFSRLLRHAWDTEDNSILNPRVLTRAMSKEAEANTLSQSLQNQNIQTTNTFYLPREKRKWILTTLRSSGFFHL